MTSGCVLCAAEPSDVEAILVVHVASIIEHGPSAYSDKQVAAWVAKTEGTDRYTNAIEEPSTELIVAKADSRVIGFGELDIESGEVKAVFVDPENAGNGIGSSILSYFEGRLQDEGFGSIRLRAVLNAVGFYEKQGYEKIERVMTRTVNNIEMDSVWMKKPL